MRSRRLLRLAGDDRLVREIQRGSDAAFEVVFERHSAALLAFCRHMLGSPEEAEDALQSTFSAAYRDLRRPRDRELVLRPWLFTIARNQCISVLRARRELPSELPELATAGLADQVERRAELRELVADVRDLPDEQRAALLLAEVGGLTQGEIAAVLGCEVARVKALVYRARSSLIARREARERPCHEVQEQLANLRGGSLRRTELRLHLRDCPGCRDFREQVKRQRQLLAVALPVTPALGLKASVLGAIGIGGGAGGGGAAAAKVVVVAVVAAGGVAGSAAVVERADHAQQQRAPALADAPSDPERPVAVAPVAAPAPAGTARTRPAQPGSGRERRSEASSPRPDGRPRQPTVPDETPAAAVDKTPPGQLKRAEHEQHEQRGQHGRGPVEHPHGVPVRRGPPDHAQGHQAKPPKPERGAADHEPRATARPEAGAPNPKANGPKAKGPAKD